MIRTREELEDLIEEIDDMLSCGQKIDFTKLIDTMTTRGYSDKQIQEMTDFIINYED